MNIDNDMEYWFLILIIKNIYKIKIIRNIIRIKKKYIYYINLNILKKKNIFIF